MTFLVSLARPDLALLASDTRTRTMRPAGDELDSWPVVAIQDDTTKLVPTGAGFLASGPVDGISHLLGSAVRVAGPDRDAVRVALGRALVLFLDQDAAPAAIRRHHTVSLVGCDAGGCYRLLVGADGELVPAHDGPACFCPIGASEPKVQRLLTGWLGSVWDTAPLPVLVPAIERLYRDVRAHTGADGSVGPLVELGLVQCRDGLVQVTHVGPVALDGVAGVESDPAYVLTAKAVRHIETGCPLPPGHAGPCGRDGEPLVIAGQYRSLAQVVSYLVPNGEFDIWDSVAGQPHAWSVDGGDASNCARDTTVVLSGDAAAKYSFGSGGSAGTYRGFTTQDQVAGAFCVPLKAGVTYRIKLSTRCSSVAGTPDYRITFTHNVAGSLTSVRTIPFAAATTWQTDEFMFTVPAGAEPNSKLAIEFKRGNTSAQDFWVDSLRMDEVGQRYRCKATHSANQVVAHLTLTALAWDSEEYDVGALHDTATNNSRITIPKGGDSGLWIFVANVDWAVSNVGTRVVAVRKNGTTNVGRTEVAPQGGFDTGQQCVALVNDVAAGDYFEVVVQQASGGNLNVGSVSDRTHFTATHVW